MTSGKGKLIIFLHGFPEFWYAWKNQLAVFGKAYLAVAPDMRGYNLSSKPADLGQYQGNFLVEDVRALAEHLGQKKFFLVGHDWGGAVAWVFAAVYPDYLEKLVIINAPHPSVFDRELRENPEQQKASQYMLMLRSPAAEQNLSANNYAMLVETVLGDGPARRERHFTEDDRRAYLEAWSQPGALTGGLNYYRAARLGPPTRENPVGARHAAPLLPVDLASLTVRVPTLVIWGEKDPYLLAGNLNGLERFVTDLTIRRVPDGSHWVIREKPDLVNAAIRDFLEGKRS